MTFNKEYWIAQAEDMELLLGMRTASVDVLQLRRELKECQERAAIFEEWKDKVEEQRRGLEIQVGEIERQRLALEQELSKSSLRFNARRVASKIRMMLSKIRHKIGKIFK